MNQTLTIDGETYQVDRTVVGAIDEMQTEIETLRNVLVQLAVFIGGDPCWCRYAKTGEHTEACRTALKLKLWPRVVGTKAHRTQRDYLPWKDEAAVATPNDAAKDFGNCVNCNHRIYRTGRHWYHQSSGGMSCSLNPTNPTTNKV